VAAFEQVLTRPPTAAEEATCLKFLEVQEQAARAPVDVAAASKPVTAPAEVPPSADPAMRARESLVHALLNHNDFVTIR
jgi:hypothetical protein